MERTCKKQHPVFLRVQEEPMGETREDRTADKYIWGLQKGTYSNKGERKKKLPSRII